MNLLRAKKGIDLKVKSIHKGRRARNKLENLGIREGVIIRKVSQQAFKGPIIINFGRTRVALGYKLAHSISVEELE